MVLGQSELKSFTQVLSKVLAVRKFNGKDQDLIVPVLINLIDNKESLIALFSPNDSLNLLYLLRIKMHILL
jgi:hypothetical protein